MATCHGAGGAGTKYTYAQLEGLWINAGGPKSQAPLAAAIALAESGGCTSALNLTDNGGTQTSVGLWQVSNGTHTYPASWNNAAGNAKEAVAKYNGSGSFAPWGTYSSGAYKAFLNGSTTPDTNVPSSSGDTTTAASTGAAGPCVVALPKVGPIGGGCIISKSAARALIGGLMLGSGAVITGVGVIVLLATAFGRSKAAGKAETVAGMVPGYGTAVAAGIRGVRKVSR